MAAAPLWQLHPYSEQWRAPLLDALGATPHQQWPTAPSHCHSAEELLTALLLVQKERGISISVVTMASQQDKVTGLIAFYYDDVDGLATPLVAYWFAPGQWQGSDAVGALRQAIDVAFAANDLFYVTTLLADHDDRSITLAVRSGLHYCRTIHHHGQRLQSYQRVKVASGAVAYGGLSTEFYDCELPIASSMEVSFHEERLRELKGPALEPMCGSGRLMIPLLQRGWQVVGVDSSAAMLEKCRRRCALLGLTPQLVQQPIHAMQLGRQYNYIFVALGSLQLLSGAHELTEALRAIRRHLSPDGLFVCDLFTPLEAIAAKGKPILQRRLVTTARATIMMEQTAAVDIAGQYYTQRSLFTKLEEGKPIAEETEDLTIHWYHRHAFAAMLSQCGFKLLNVYERPHQRYPFSQTYEATTASFQR